MNVPIVVSTGQDRTDWLRDCLASITRERVTIVRPRTGGELAAIRMVYDSTHWPRWVMVQDSCVVLDDALWDMVDCVTGPALLVPRPCMYMAVYDRRVLDMMSRAAELEYGTPDALWPDVAAGVDRAAAIDWETKWMDQYVATAESMDLAVPVLMPDFTDASAQRTEFHNGRLNLVLENRFLRKYKGTWR